MIIYRQPVATPRPRVTRFGKVYYTKNYKEYLKLLRDDLKHYEIPDGALSVSIRFVLKRPQRLRKGDRVIHDRRPDLDNLVKGVLDALPIDDDARVVQLSAIKWYASSEEAPNILLEITEFQPKKNTPE
jgi:Holliday junction resolvase RusA-like endonuclease